MTDTIDESLPWATLGARVRAAATETTPGGSEPLRWVVVGENFFPAEAAIVKSRLESEQIPALVQQEAIGSVFGLTVGPLGSARVLVPEPLVERALAILADTFEVEEDYNNPNYED